MPQGEVVGTFDDYVTAVAFVEKLIANEFPAQFIAIVGKNLRTVERVRNRVDQGRVALSGAITGSWIGFLYALFTNMSASSTSVGLGTLSLGSVAPSVLVGAGLGTIFNVLRFSLARNKRSFASQSMVIASEYQVQVPTNLVSDANTAAAKAEEKPAN
jgi:hypothetical protein